MYTRGLIMLYLVGVFMNRVETASINSGVRSDTIVTKFYTGSQTNTTEIDPGDIQEGKPGWLRLQLIRFGGIFSQVGSKLGGFSARVTRALDNFCEVIKTIIPVVAAVCHVGQFQFCGSINDAPQEFADALAPNNINLNIQDK